MPEINQEQAAKPPVDNAKKIPLTFRRRHIHDDKVYNPGDKGNFTQAEADMIRKTGAVEMPPPLTDAEKKAAAEKAATEAKQ